MPTKAPPETAYRTTLYTRSCQVSPPYNRALHILVRERANVTNSRGIHSHSHQYYTGYRGYLSYQQSTLARVCPLHFRSSGARCLHTAHLMSLTILHVGMVGEPGIGITSLTSLFEYNRLPTPRLPRCSGLSDAILPASLPLFSKHSTSYPPDSEWSDWRWYRSVPITIQHWLSVEKRQTTGTREIVQIHQEELDVARDPSVRDHYNGFHAIAICFSVIDRKSFKMVMEKVTKRFMTFSYPSKHSY